MFKNFVLFKINAGWDITHQHAIEAVASNRFKPTLPTQDKSYGWVEPRGEDHADLVESIDGQLILKLMMETRAVPGGAVRKKAQAEADRIEAETGRKPGKKETLKLREDALLSLLPNTNPAQSSFWVWVDRENGCVAIDASSQGKVDDVVTALVRAFGGMAMTQLKTALSPATAMTQWLLGLEHGESPQNFNVDRDCELKSTDQEKSSVKFNRHNLNCEEVRNHLVQGMAPTKLAPSCLSPVSKDGVTPGEVAPHRDEFMLPAVASNSRPDVPLRTWSASVANTAGHTGNLRSPCHRQSHGLLHAFNNPVGRVPLGSRFAFPGNAT